jgi:site-specific DNA-cytosine methylase
MEQFSKITGSNLQVQNICAVDLFCGAGGLTRGLEKSGIEVALGVDIDPPCSYPYSENNAAEFLLKCWSSTISATD